MLPYVFLNITIAFSDIILIHGCRFVSEFFKEPDRGYGGSIAAVFNKLEKSGCSDPFLPAKEQFDGQGSFGNGGAMRISPAALYGYHLSEEELNVSTSETSDCTCKEAAMDASCGKTINTVSKELQKYFQMSVPKGLVDPLHGAVPVVCAQEMG